MSKQNTPPPHIEAQVGDIAETVLLPGDPLRALAAKMWRH